VRRLHWPLRDPSGLAAFRDARDRLTTLLPQLWNDSRQR